MYSEIPVTTGIQEIYMSRIYPACIKWIPVVLGDFGSITTTLMALYHNITRSDYFTFFWVMILMIVLGVLGLGLHINADLPEWAVGIQVERFIRGAPVMAPMLFAIMGAFGLITMIDAPVLE
jgi:hypothetical protein